MDNVAAAFVPHGRFRIEGRYGGPLAGTTFAAKDLFDVAGHPTGAGNPRWLETHPVPGVTSPVVQALLEAGASLIGKTITDELAYSMNGDNMHYGTPVNTRAPGRVPGGSSSGSAAAVAAGACDFALGTDTGGSVRVPASHCGLWGIRPTHGAISVAGLVPLMPSYDTVGWLARSGAMLRRVGEVLLPADTHGKLTGVVFPEDVWREAAPALEPLLRSVLSVLETILGPARKLVLAPEGLERWRLDYLHASAHEGWQVHGAWIEAHRPVFAEAIARRWAFAREVTAEQAAAARAGRARHAARVRRALGREWVAVVPSAADVAPPLGASGPEVEAYRARMLKVTSIAGHAGLPQVNIPLVTEEGLPFGVSLVGPAGSDRALMALAAEAAARLATRRVP